jgi:uncharacterized membrane protein
MTQKYMVYLNWMLQNGQKFISHFLSFRSNSLIKLVQNLLIRLFLDFSGVKAVGFFMLFQKFKGLTCVWSFALLLYVGSEGYLRT